MTIFNAFVSTLDKATGEIKQSDYAKQLFKQSIDVGTAVVNILGNTGIAGFKFNLPMSEQLKLQADVTDHYIDTNRPIQDHIALKPVTITLNGLQGEYFYSVNKLEDTLALITPTLSLVKQFLPKLSDVTMNLKTEYNNQMLSKLAANTFFGNEKDLIITDKLISSVKTGALNNVDLFKIFQDLYKLKSAQTRAFFFFQALMEARSPFSVETTYRRFDNCIVTDLIPLRDNNADITDFTLTFKQLNFTETKSTTVEKAVGRTYQQLSELSAKGVDKGKKVEAI